MRSMNLQPAFRIERELSSFALGHSGQPRD
jgi:hypothetical protein